jgi:quinol monooxygenase YgiN
MSIHRRALSFLAVATLIALVLSPVPRIIGDEKPNPVITKVKASIKDPTAPFTLIVHFEAKEDAGPKLEAAIAKAIKATRKEKGCLAYDLNRSSKTPTKYLMYERWKSLPALEAHLKSEHFATLLKDLGDLLASPPEFHVLIPAGD